jgi:SAM-dependent methyltransferase
MPLQAASEYPYGTEPNPFLVSASSFLERGAVLSLGEGEGRNAVFLASLGHSVLGVDCSADALDRARRLAIERGVPLELHCADLSTFELEEAQFQTIVSIFCHLPPRVRRRVHAQVVRALRPGGMFVFEAFRPEQLTFGTGGPTELALLPTKEEILSELRGLDILRVGQVERLLDEGIRHVGPCAVLELIARKPYVHRPKGPVN